MSERKGEEGEKKGQFNTSGYNEEKQYSREYSWTRVYSETLLSASRYKPWRSQVGWKREEIDSFISVEALPKLESPGRTARPKIRYILIGASRSTDMTLKAEGPPHSDYKKTSELRSSHYR
jgi:hypothetical protein